MSALFPFHYSGTRRTLLGRAWQMGCVIVVQSVYLAAYTATVLGTALYVWRHAR